ncbi:hypothetical protein ABPG72_014504 [Tetrahymena utriculariae]
MDQEKKQSKCNIHSNFNNNLLLFEENNIQTKICLVCAKQITENLNRLIEYDEFIHADQNYVFSSFPPLNDKNIYNTIKNLLIQKDSSIQDIFIEKIKQYRKTIKNISEYQEMINKINLKTPIEIQQKILDLIDQIDFFEKPQEDINNIEFEKSKSYGVSYANFILDPNQKYILRAKLQTNSNADSFLIVGIIQEQDKDNKQ